MPKKLPPPPGELPVPGELVERRIYLIRGQKVMLNPTWPNCTKWPPSVSMRQYAETLTASLKILCSSSAKKRAIL